MYDDVTLWWCDTMYDDVTLCMMMWHYVWWCDTMYDDVTLCMMTWDYVWWCDTTVGSWHGSHYAEHRSRRGLWALPHLCHLSAALRPIGTPSKNWACICRSPTNWLHMYVCMYHMYVSMYVCMYEIYTHELITYIYIYTQIPVYIWTDYIIYIYNIYIYI